MIRDILTSLESTVTSKYILSAGGQVLIEYKSFIVTNTLEMRWRCAYVND